MEKIGFDNTGIKVGFWNVNGLSEDKSSDQSFQEQVGLFDILFLSETWLNETSFDKICHPEGYLCDYIFRKHKKKKGRPSGGVMVYYKKELKNFISVYDKSAENILWLKIRKGMVSQSQEVYIAGVYNSPKNSNYAKRNENSNIIPTLQKQLSKFSPSDLVLIGGDFNSRVGTRSDFIFENDKDLKYLPSDYELDKTLKARNNQDMVINEYGQQLLDLCITSKMRILNGRTRGDLQGHLTYVGYHGSSTVDLVLASETLIFETPAIIQYLSVLELSCISDHKPILIKLYNSSEKNTLKSKKNDPKEKLKNKPTRYVWRNDSDRIYSEQLNLETENQKNASSIPNLNVNDKIEILCEEVKSIFIGAANQCLNRQKIYQKRKQKPKIVRKHWFNNDCQVIRKNLKYVCKSLSKDPKNPFTKEKFFKLKKMYRSICRKTKRKFEQNLFQKLEDLHNQDRDRFWNTLKLIKNGHGQNKSMENLPPPEDLTKHYKTLLQKKPTYSLKTTEVDPKPKEMNEANKVFNNEISLEEIQKAIKSLKRNKAPGKDNVTNEMIKCSNSFLIHKLYTLFNEIFNSGIYPKSWNTDLIYSVHKSGNKDDPNNYRGITLSNCISKLFHTVLFKRFESLFEKENIISPAQAGFRKNHRTTDHIFTLFTLIKKYMKKGYLYTCFVDFRKAYDTICRDSLLHKLRGVGVEGKMLKLLKSMYSTTEVSLIYQNYLTDSFPTTVGLKQGDLLSTIFFNLYINDLPTYLSSMQKKYSPEKTPMLNEAEISSLLFADDLVILALTKEDLQEKLQILEDYCDKWGLEVNIKKTKIMIFNKQGSVIRKHQFFYKNQALETAKQYTYLGFTFVPSGSKTVGIDNLISKGKKAWFSIQKMIAKSKEKTISAYLKLIDSIIKPIILYASESWGDALKNDVFVNKLEKFHLSMCKQILGVNKSVNNIKVLAELGRYPLKISIETQMFKYLQRFPFLDKDRYLVKAFEEDLLSNNGWVNNIKGTLERYGIYNLMNNILKVRKGEITKELYKKKHKFFQKRATDCYLQEKFYKYIDENDNFFSDLKNVYGKEKYLELKNFEHRKAISKLRLASHKLEIVMGKWNKVPKEMRICKNCNKDKVEDETHFLLQCSKYEHLRQVAMGYIFENEDLNLNNKSEIKTLKDFFSNGSLTSLNILGQFIKDAFNSRESK